MLQVNKKVVEEVWDVEEFRELLHPKSRVHYELYWRYAEVIKAYGFPTKVEAGVIFYGLSRERFVLRCLVREVISWDDERLIKYGKGNLYDNYNEWIKERWQEFKKLAEEIGATPGRFAIVEEDDSQ